MNNYIKPTGKTRNKPCPCGSNIKLKNCCGTSELHNEYNIARLKAQAETRAKRQAEREAYIQKMKEQGKPLTDINSVILIAGILSGSGLLQPPIRPKKSNRMKLNIKS
jgi:hypothetical protein